jgi:hypothetical protein
MLSTRYAHSARMGFPRIWPDPQDRVPLYVREAHRSVLRHMWLQAAKSGHGFARDSGNVRPGILSTI